MSLLSKQLTNSSVKVDLLTLMKKKKAAPESMQNRYNIEFMVNRPGSLSDHGKA